MTGRYHDRRDTTQHRIRLDSPLHGVTGISVRESGQTIFAHLKSYFRSCHLSELRAQRKGQNLARESLPGILLVSCRKIDAWWKSGHRVCTTIPSLYSDSLLNQQFNDDVLEKQGIQGPNNTFSSRRRVGLFSCKPMDSTTMYCDYYSQASTKPNLNMRDTITEEHSKKVWPLGLGTL